MKDKLQKYILKYKIIIIWMIILSLFGLTLLKLQSINNPTPDDEYLKSKQQSYQTDKIRIKDSVREEIEKLENIPVNTQPGQVGTSDPFNP
jgi:hypothetical protein